MTRSVIVTYRPDRYAGVERTYVVLGAPRGGTSMVAGALHTLGVPMGAVRHTYEDREFHDETNIDGMRRTIAHRNRTHAQWGWKLPNTIYYFDEIAGFLRNPVFVAVYRNPLEVFMSAAAKDGELNEATFNAPVYHYARMHRVIHDHAAVPAFLLSYEAACAAPTTFAEDLANILPFRPTPDATARCAAFIDPVAGYRATS